MKRRNTRGSHHDRRAAMRRRNVLVQLPEVSRRRSQARPVFSRYARVRDGRSRTRRSPPGRGRPLPSRSGRRAHPTRGRSAPLPSLTHSGASDTRRARFRLVSRSRMSSPASPDPAMSDVGSRRSPGAPNSRISTGQMTCRPCGRKPCSRRFDREWRPTAVVRHARTRCKRWCTGRLVDTSRAVARQSRRSHGRRAWTMSRWSSSAFSRTLVRIS